MQARKQPEGEVIAELLAAVPSFGEEVATRPAALDAVDVEGFCRELATHVADRLERGEHEAVGDVFDVVESALSFASSTLSDQVFVGFVLTLVRHPATSRDPGLYLWKLGTRSYERLRRYDESTRR